MNLTSTSMSMTKNNVKFNSKVTDLTHVNTDYRYSLLKKYNLYKKSITFKILFQ